MWTCRQHASEIFVANPKVANAVVRSSRKLYVIATGWRTDNHLRDGQGGPPDSVPSKSRSAATSASLTASSRPPSQLAKVDARTVNDTIILTGSVASAGDAQKVMDIATGFVGARPDFQRKVINSLNIRGRDQVMLKVTIAEVQRQIIKQLGVSRHNGRRRLGSVDPRSSAVAERSQPFQQQSDF